jgi:hypothetical protein
MVRLHVRIRRRLKASGGNNLAILAADPSRLTSLLGSSFVSTESSLAPRQPGASTAITGEFIPPDA